MSDDHVKIASFLIFVLAVTFFLIIFNWYPDYKEIERYEYCRGTYEFDPINITTYNLGLSCDQIEAIIKYDMKVPALLKSKTFGQGYFCYEKINVQTNYNYYEKADLEKFYLYNCIGGGA